MYSLKHRGRSVIRSSRPLTGRACLRSLSLLSLCFAVLACSSDESEAPPPPRGPTFSLSGEISDTCSELVAPVVSLRDSNRRGVTVTARLRRFDESDGLRLRLYSSFDEVDGIFGQFQSWYDFLAEASLDEVIALEDAGEPCLTNYCSDILTLSGESATDTFYCTAPGTVTLEAEILEMPEGGVLQAQNKLTVRCVREADFAENCQSGIRLGSGDQGSADRGDLGPGDMGDMAGPDFRIPDSWSIRFVPGEESAREIAVKEATSGRPNSAPLTFSVTDNLQRPIPNVPVSVHLNWPYEPCTPCEFFRDAMVCGERFGCVWGEESGCLERPEVASGDPRCADNTHSCIENLCLPENQELPVSPPPPEETPPALGGLPTSSMAGGYAPGVCSAPAAATLEDTRLSVSSRPVTIHHGIPTQQSLDLRCDRRIASAFVSRGPLDPTFGQQAHGYIFPTLTAGAIPEVNCRFGLADRFSGRIPEGTSVFLLSEGGSVPQSMNTPEGGEDSAGSSAVNFRYELGAPPPRDVSPLGWEPSRIVSHNPDNLPLPGTRSDYSFNPRDGLSRVVAFTQGEATFIDIDNDTVYTPSKDLVPPQPEPFIDTNDDGVWQQGEPYHDVNGDNSWNSDTFGRSADIQQQIRTLITQLQGGEEINRPMNIDSPSNLRTTIWTESSTLWIGAPQFMSFDEPISPRGRLVSLDCKGHPGCYIGEIDGPFNCAVSGSYDVYLDNSPNVLAGPAYFEATVRPRDDNLNCAGESVLSSTFGDGSSFQLSAPAAAELWPYPLWFVNQMSHTIGETGCFNRDLQLRPTNYDYRMRYQRTDKPEQPVVGEGEAPPSPELSVIQLTIRIENQTLSRYQDLAVSVALCE
ncbi:MAG: hypothetical protein VYD19_09810 [Myxococcota bacterium]|nr:hypothetical protein [Myxococcota bacterium]